MAMHGKYSSVLLNNLLNIYKQFGQIVVAYDFDSTVYDYKKTGEKYLDVIKVLQKAKKTGACKFFVFTDLNKETVKILEPYLQKNNIPYDNINKCPIKVPFGEAGKPYYNILLDDKAGLDQSLEILNEFCEIVNSDNLLPYFKDKQ